MNVICFYPITSLSLRLSFCAVVLVVLVCLGVGAPVARAECANEAVRAEQGTAALALPECRGYELVSPPGDKPNFQVNSPTVSDGSGAVEAQAAGDGGAIVFNSYYSPSGAPSNGSAFLSTRGASGWVTQALAPNVGPEVEAVCFEDMFFPPDLIGDVFRSKSGGCGAPEPPLVADEPRSTGNVLVRASDSEPYSLVNVTPVGVVPGDAWFEAASSDLSHVVFIDPAQLTAEAPVGSTDLYVWTASGGVRLVTYLPSGAPVAGVLADAYEENDEHGFGVSPATLVHSVSDDGERVVFTAGGNLYLRVNAAQASSGVSGGVCVDSGLACTVQLDVTSPGAEGLSGGGEFLWMSADGSRVFFSDQSRLTVGSTAVSGKPDLYEYDVATGELHDLTVDVSGAADVIGVLGASEDGSYVYFVADGVLTGTQTNSVGAKASSGHPNLYLAHAGVTTFVATLSPDDGWDWGENANVSGPTRRDGVTAAELSTLVSSDGLMIAFNSIAKVTDYENLPLEKTDCYGTNVTDKPGEPCNEIFEFNASNGRLVCVSCGPAKSKPTGNAELRAPDGTYPRRALSIDGRVFFDTPSSLANASNGVSDVYEWSPVGVGGCEESSSAYTMNAGGCQYMLSGGTSSEPSYFADASENGEDVYFVTAQALIAGDTDNAESLYDARVDGGRSGEDVVVEEGECRGVEECKRPPGEPPVLFAPGTVGAVGAGDLAVRLPEQSGGGSAGTLKRVLTRSQKLVAALKACRKQPKRKRGGCETSARKRYGPVKREKSKKGAKAKRGGRR